MATLNQHSHSEHSSEALLASARSTLIRAGEQWTSMREAVFAELAQHQRPASAYLIADNLSQKRGRRVAPNSIYRILDLFVAKNLAIRIESANAFLANSHPGHRHDCIFLVCDECGEANHVDDDQIGRSLRGLAKANDFNAQRPVIEIRGICAACN